MIVCELTQHDSWNGLSILNPFNYPDVAVSIVIKGVQSLQLGDSRYQLESTSELNEVKNSLASILNQVVFDQVDLYSGDKKMDAKLEKLDSRHEAVQDFLKDISLLKDLKEKVKQKQLHIPNCSILSTILSTDSIQILCKDGVD